MKSYHAPAALLAVFALAGASSAATGKVRLLLKAKAGQVARYRSEENLSVESGGMKVNLEMKETEKVTFTDVAASGNVTAVHEPESSEQSVNGQKLPSEESGRGKDTVVLRPDGGLVSYRMSVGGSEEAKLAARVFGCLNPLFSDKEVGVGDRWSRDTKADAELGISAAHSDYEVLGFEKLNGVDTVKVKMTYRETEASPAITSSGTLWLETSSGDEVSLDMQVENLPFGGNDAKVLASGKMHQERIAGGPLGGPVDASGKPIPPKEKTIDDVVKDFEKLPGLFTAYRKKEAGRETTYLEIRQDQLEKLFLLQATASTGTAEAVIAGDPLNDIVFKFQEIPDDRLLMVTPNIGFQAAADSPIARSVQRSFAPGYLESFKIEARQPDRKSLLINISDLFRGDIAQVSQALSSGGGLIIPGFGGGKSYSLDREKTYVAAFKVFPDNMFVQTAYHFSSGGGASGALAALMGNRALADPRSVPLKVDFNLFPLANASYRPRLADPRVGYFYTEYQDFTDDSKDTQMVRYILRWDLEKKDPNAALSEPKKPITFWLDNAIPTEYRDAVREGILMWNKGFEKVGIKNAIVVNQMPDNADWDHADMRYNVIRWSTTQSPPYGAVALFRVNPLTGQIVNAGITVDAALTRSTKMERKQLVDPAAYFQDDSGPKKAFRPFRCDLAAGAMDQSWFGDLALNLLALPGEKVDEKAYTHSFLRSVVAHEMGHVLGLFHNFAASTQLSLDDLKDPSKVRAAGVTASVMDYVPFNVAALKQKGVDYWSSTIGTYDFWAVEYGYTPLLATSPADETGRLKLIASRCNQPGHAFQNDLLADQWDPNVTRFDLGSDPLAYWSRMLQLSRHLLLTLGTRLPRNGESYWSFTRAFNGLLGQYSRSAAMASRYVGGLHVNRNFKGDPGEKPVLQPIDGAKQRQALEALNTYLFSENAFAFPAGYYGHLTGDPFPSMEAFTAGGGSQDFPIRNQLVAIQRGAMQRLFSPAVLNRVVNNEFKAGTGNGALTLPELFHSVSASVWTELNGHRNISSLRRELQRDHTDLMINMAISPSGIPEDARMLAWDQLRQLKTRIQAVRRQGQDEYTRVHLDETLMRINRALNATQTVGGGGSRGGSLLQLLLGEHPTSTPQ